MSPAPLPLMFTVQWLFSVYVEDKSEVARLLGLFCACRVMQPKERTYGFHS